MNQDILKIGSPAKAGIRYQDIHAFLDAVEQERLMLHGFVLSRNDAVFAEGYYAPFKQDFMHRIYSSSKTFTAMAIGALAGEGKIDLDDPVYKYFPDKCPQTLHPWIEGCTIRHLLMMATPFDHLTYWRDETDWLIRFFNDEPNLEPNTKFIYNTTATVLLDAIVERVTKKPFLDYLMDVGLRKIGISEDIWCIQSPDGISWGGSGVICTCRDLARLAILMKNKGEFQGEQILPRDFIEQATTKQIENHGKITDLSHSHGYGYQTWICEKGFALLGMGSQCVWVEPEMGTVAAFTADTQCDGKNPYLIFDLFKEHIYDHIGEPYEEDPAEQKKLEMRIAKLKVPVPKGDAHSPLEQKIGGKTFILQPNPMGIECFRFEFEGDRGTWYYDTPRGKKELPFGLGWNLETTFPETHYQDRKIMEAGNREFFAFCSAVWRENTLLVRPYVADHCFGNGRFFFTFEEDRVTVQMANAAEWFMDEYEGTAEGKIK